MENLSKAVQERYFAWLSMHVKPAQLSELYQCYERLDRFCLYRKILQKPVFETIDVTQLNRAYAELEKSKLFRMEYRSQIALSGLRHYIRFVRENQAALLALKDGKAVPGSKPENTKQSTKDEPAGEAKSVDVVLDLMEKLRLLNGEAGQSLQDKAKEAPVKPEAAQPPQTGEDSVPDVKGTDAVDKGEFLTVDFSVEGRYSFTVPVSIRYLGILHPVSDWRQAYIQILACLANDFPDRFKRLKGKTIVGRDVLLFGDERMAAGMKKPLPIPGTGLHAETGFNANNLVRLMGMLLRSFAVNPKRVVIQYRRTMPGGLTEAAPIAVETPVEAPAETPVEASVKMPPETTAETPQKHIVSAEPADLSEPDGLTMQGDAAPSMLRKRRTAEETKAQFQAWMQNQGLFSGISAVYANLLERCSHYALAHGFSKVQFYDMRDADEVRDCFNDLLCDVEFLGWNAFDSKQTKTAVLKYLKFLQENVVGNETLFHTRDVYTEVTEALPREELAQQLVMECVPSDPILSYAERNRIAWIDKRPQNGCLWLVGDMGLSAHIHELRYMGYDFRYAKDGGKATEGKPGWFLPRNAQKADAVQLEIIFPPKTASSDKKLSAELQSLLTEDVYQPLRECLLQEGILTVEQLEAENPWVFMNRHGLYSIAQRQALFKQIMARLRPVEEVQSDQLYVLKTRSCVYRGKSAAEAFAAFCDNIAQKYPLKLRSLLDAPYNGTGSVVLSRTPPAGAYARLMNPVAYISGTLSTQAAMVYGKWICKMCGETDAPVEMLAPRLPTEAEKPVQPSSSKETREPVAPISQGDSSMEQAPSGQGDASKQQTSSGQSDAPKSQVQAVAALTERAERTVLEADLEGMTIDALARALGTTMVATRQAVADSRHIVSLCGKLIHEDAFVDWEDGANRMEQILDKLLDKNDGYVSAAQLYEYVHADMQMFLNDNDIDDLRAVYDLAQHLFVKLGYHGKWLNFSTKQHISRGAAAVSNVLDIMQNFAREQGGFFRDEELACYLKRVGIKTGNMRGQMQLHEKPVFFLYGERSYMSGESIGFSDAWFETAQQALDRLFADMGDHVVLRDIQPWWYAQLPTLPGDRAWTALLLQGILLHYSEKLRGAHTICAMEGQSNDTLHAMLVSGDSEIHCFADAVAAFLIDGEVAQRRFEAEELRQMLVQRGMIAGNELTWNMPKALARDERFAWDADGQHVTVKV